MKGEEKMTTTTTTATAYKKRHIVSDVSIKTVVHVYIQLVVYQYNVWLLCLFYKLNDGVH